MKMNPLDVVELGCLMKRTTGNREVKIGLIDGPVAMDHPDLTHAHFHVLSGQNGGACVRPDSAACIHGTFVAGILCASRNSSAPAICPGCTLLIRPIFLESSQERQQTPSATPDELAMAIIDCVSAGARIINLSLGLAQPHRRGGAALTDALNYAARLGTIVVAAAGNQGSVGSTIITAHPWVIPVVSCTSSAGPTRDSNLGGSIGRRGLSAPGEEIRGLGSDGQSVTSSGTSIAAAFVTGTTALLWSEFPMATAAQIKFAVTRIPITQRASVVPPLLNGRLAYNLLATSVLGGT